MLKNYLNIGIRNLLKNKLFSSINIAGMAISIGTFLIITLFVADELKFDRHVKDVSLKFRVFNELFLRRWIDKKRCDDSAADRSDAGGRIS